VPKGINDNKKKCNEPYSVQNDKILKLSQDQIVLSHCNCMQANFGVLVETIMAHYIDNKSNWSEEMANWLCRPYFIKLLENSVIRSVMKVKASIK
jgi:hypothetical protein